MTKKKKIFAFVDASNLFYGGEKSLGWKIDYKKLIAYVRERYGVSKVFYYGGVELNGYPYSILYDEQLDLEKLVKYLRLKQKAEATTETQVIVIEKHIKRIKFYIKLQSFGFILNLKPVKIFRDSEGNTTKKANCDVDMTFDMMRLFSDYDGALVLSGDGDFVVILKYLMKSKKELTVLARGERTAREIRQLLSGNFRDFNYLRELIEYKK